MKALFILTGGQFLYGANRSISGLLRELDYEYDIMICKGFTTKIDEESIRQILGKNLKNIYECWLPRYRCYFFDKNGFISELSHYINNCMAYLCRHKKNVIIEKGNYDVIHLNSLVLYPLINKDKKYIIHARELINPKYKWIDLFKKHIRKAAGIIYIDVSTQKSVEAYYEHKKGIVINNPFDMLTVENLEYRECMNRFQLSYDTTVFSMLGQIGKSKGSDLVLEAFHRVKSSNIAMLVVGNYEHKFGRMLIEKYKDDKRIIFCGEYLDTSPIFRISDYILRGEDQFCIGRTIYEGLYSGCGVIIPGNESNLESIVENEIWGDKIVFYEPVNLNELVDCIDACAKKKFIEKKYYSNTKDYVKKYKAFIEDVLFSEVEVHEAIYR